MMRAAFHWILILSLLLETAPVMAGAAAHASMPEPAATHEVSLHSAHHMHDGIDSSVAPDRADPSVPHECCQGPSCDCGCVLTSAIPTRVWVWSTPSLRPARRIEQPDRVFVTRTSPPFRPPAA